LDNAGRLTLYFWRGGGVNRGILYPATWHDLLTRIHHSYFTMLPYNFRKIQADEWYLQHAGAAVHQILGHLSHTSPVLQ
jgi:hypothetical protein